MKKAGSILLICVTVLFFLIVSGMFFIRSRGNEESSDVVLSENGSQPHNEMHEWRININTANVEELTLLPGIGPALAQRIIDYREENGPFSSCSQLKNVKGIGQITYEGLRDYIVLEDNP